MTHTSLSLNAPSILPSSHNICTLRLDIFHFSATSFSINYRSILTSIIPTSVNPKNQANRYLFSSILNPSFSNFTRWIALHCPCDINQKLFKFFNMASSLVGYPSLHFTLINTSCFVESLNDDLYWKT